MFNLEPLTNKEQIIKYAFYSLYVDRRFEKEMVFSLVVASLS